MERVRTYSRATKLVAEILGGRIRAGRKERRMPERELAERVGISRSTLRKIERGDLRVELGVTLEAALVVGVPLLGAPDVASLRTERALLNDRLALLPQRARPKARKVYDDF